jgi:dTDP-4-amino-4,6-dideoxygalactose transaminase
VVILPPELATARSQIIATLARRKVLAGAPYSPPLHLHPYFRELADRPLPVTEAMSGRVLSLPFFTSITDVDIEYVAAALAAAEAAAIRPGMRCAGGEVGA